MLTIRYRGPDAGKLLGNVPNHTLTQDEATAIAYDAGCYRTQAIVETSLSKQYSAMLWWLWCMSWLMPTRQGDYLPRVFVDRFLEQEHEYPTAIEEQDQLPNWYRY